MAGTSRMRLASQRGSSMVEFGLILPIFFLLVFGFVDFAVVFFGYCNAAYASQVAVRYAIVHGSSSASPCTATDLTNIVTPYLWLAPKNSTTVTSAWAPNNSAGSSVSVTVTINYSTAIPFSSVRTVTVGTVAHGTMIY